ncbi:MAG: T9SS type A sorting domain-containing protein [Bacteroidales bacterium]|nr:T9SS type A sorting domain-containing protein [Bacteroidales bacterium]
MKLVYSIKALALTLGLMLLIMVGINSAVSAQATNDYRSKATGSWATVGSWEIYSGSWIAASAAPTASTANVITILSGHTITVAVNVTVDQVVIASGGQVTINSGRTLTIANGSGTDLSVSGKLLTNSTSGTSGFTISTGATMAFLSGGTYQHNIDGEAIPTATWDAASTCLVTGIIRNAPTTGLSQAFGNFTWNSANTTSVTLSSNTISGNLTISNGGSSQFRIRPSSNTCTVAGNYIQSGTSNVSLTSSTPIRTLAVSGSFSMTGGTLDLSYGTVAGILNVAGNFTHTGGTITETSTTVGVAGSINFNGTGSSQIFTSGGTVSNTIDFTVNTSAFLQMAAEATTVTGNSFTLSSGATLGIKSNAGITTTGTASGNIRSTTRTYNVAANYIYNGSAAQSTGNGLTTANNLTVNNTAGVNASGNLTVNGVLNLQSANPSTTKGALEMTTSYTTPGGTYPGTLATDYLVSNILDMGSAATTIGIGDVTGTVRRSTIAANTSYTFGHQYTTIALSSGTMPSEIKVSITIGTAPAGKADAIKRTYEIISANNASGSTVTANFHYLDDELNSNSEANLVTWDYDIAGGTSTPDEHGRAAYDLGANYVGMANIPISYFIQIPGTHEWRTIFTLANYGTATYIWDGSVSNVWDVADNWTLSTGGSGIPASLSHVIIPDVTNDPVLPAGITLNSISIQDGGVLVMGSNTLTIQYNTTAFTGGWEDLNPAGNDPGTSTVIFTNPGNPISGHARFYNLQIASGADITLETGSTIKIQNIITKTGNFYADVFDGTVEYSGSAQTVVLPDGTPNYHHLILSGSGIKTMPASAMTLHGDLTLSGTASLTAAAALTIKGNLNIGNGTSFDASGFTHNVGGNWSNSGTFTAGTSTINLNGTTAQTIQTAESFNNLTINNVAGVSATGNIAVNGVLNLASANASIAKGSFDIGSAYALTMGASATTSGTGDVTGVVTRNTIAASTVYTFGSQYSVIQMAATGTSLPASISVKISLNTMPWSPNIAKREYDIVQTGGSAWSASLQLHYLDNELPSGADEALLRLFDYHIATPSIHDHGQSAYDVTVNWVSAASMSITYIAPSTTFGTKIWSVGEATGNDCNWIGLSGNTTWTDAGNWSGGVPTLSSNVFILDETYDPILPTGVSIVSLTIQPDAILTCESGATLTITGGAGAWNNLGTFEANDGTVVFTNAVAEIAGINAFYNLSINSGAKLTNLAGSEVYIAGAMTNAGTWDAATNETTVGYNGTSQDVKTSGVSYFDLLLSGSGTKTFEGAATLSGNLNLSGTAFGTTSNNLTIGGNFNINPGSSFTITGTLAVTGSTNLLSDDIGTGSLIHSTGSVNGIVERYIAAADWGTWNDGWHFLSSPVASQAISPAFTVTPADEYDFYGWYEPTNEWVNIKTTTGTTWSTANGASSGFLVGKGYMAAYKTSDTKIFSGTLNVSDVSVSGLTVTGSTQTNRSWHLLGNPFSSALSWYTGWTKSNIGGVANIWNESAQGYTPVVAGEIIPAGNGFMVQADLDGASLTIPAANRVHSAQAWYKKSSDPVIKLFAHDLNNGSFQESQVRVNQEATTGFDFEFDGNFLPGYAPLFYSVMAGENLMVNSLPELNSETVIPFLFTKNEGSNFSIEVKGIETLGTSDIVYLKDKKLGIDHNLTDNNIYTFTSATVDDAARFELYFNSYTGIKETQSSNNFTVYAADGILNIHSLNQLGGKVMVSDMLGRAIATGSVEAGATTQINIHGNAGVYIVSVLTSKGRSNTKIIVK